MANYCLDSNVISDMLRGDLKVINHLKTVRDNDDILFIPSIVYYEVVRGLKAAGKTRILEAFQNFYERVEHLSLDMNAIEKSVEIYIQLRKGQNIEDNDIYIAAIAMVNGCKLVTANTRHFGRVEGLTFVNWRDS